MDQAPLVRAIAATDLGGGNELEPGVGPAFPAGGVLAELLCFNKDPLISRHAIDPDGGRDHDDGGVCHQSPN